MLVLTRKVDQRIQIGENICIVILKVQGRRVKIGVEAPAQVNVVRSELLRPAKTEQNPPRQKAT